LIVEVDGGQHDEDSDRARTVWLSKEGYRLIHFWNNDVLGNIDAVLETIADTVRPSSRLR
jgi:very-short-patch-repair endonuclease